MSIIRAAGYYLTDIAAQTNLLDFGWDFSGFAKEGHSGARLTLGGIWSPCFTIETLEGGPVIFRMGADWRRMRRRHMSGWLPLLVTCAVATSCAPSTYMGISLRAGEASPEIQHVAASARSGDKLAQLDLGIRFEQGDGVSRDWDRAAHLYRTAASDIAEIWVYSPALTRGSSGRVIKVGHIPHNDPTLAAAQARLDAISLKISNEKSFDQ